MQCVNAGSDLEGLHYLRNTADADKLVKHIQETKASGGKVVCLCAHACLCVLSVCVCEVFSVVACVGHS
jgi:hypothetical protein